MLKIFNRVEEIFLSFLLVWMTVLVFSEVIARFVFSHGISWAEEMTLNTNSWFVLLGASYCIRKKAHIGVDFIVAKLDGMTAKVVAVTAVGACLIYACIYLYGAWFYVYEDYQLGLDLYDIPIKSWIPASALVIGFALILFRLLEVLYQVIMQGNVHALQHEGEAKESMELADSIKEKNIN